MAFLLAVLRSVGTGTACQKNPVVPPSLAIPTPQRGGTRVLDPADQVVPLSPDRAPHRHVVEVGIADVGAPGAERGEGLAAPRGSPDVSAACVSADSLRKPAAWLLNRR